MSSVGQAREALSPGEVSAAGAMSGAVTRSDIHRENDYKRKIDASTFEAGVYRTKTGVRKPR